MTTSASAASATYEIRLRGHLDSRWAEQLGIFQLTQDPDGTTLLSGIAADQAVLHGLLQRIRDLGLPLISVQRIASSSKS
jgi:hypothetical protein